MDSLNEFFNIQRNQFLALQQKVNGHPLAYLDSAATTLKPQRVVERIKKFYDYESSNVHRGAHFLSHQATVAFEAARIKIQKFIGAQHFEEIIFTKGTTEGINLIATSYGHTFLNEGDEIVLTELEHHANLVPWQNLAIQKKLKLKFIPINLDGSLNESVLDDVITEKTKIVAFTGCSNTLGILTPVEKIIAKAKSVNAVTVLDGAQLVSQVSIDVQKLNVDFLVFSAHKIFGPFGFGVLYGQKKWLDIMPPYQFGGSMISTVDFERSSYNEAPFKFEAGTPHIEGAIGTAEAIDFIQEIQLEKIFQHEQKLLKYTTDALESVGDVQIYGTSAKKASIVSFNLMGAHHSDVGQILDQQGVAVRVGHHCTQPLMKKLNITGTVRASLSLYNNTNDVDQFIAAVQKAKRMLL